MNIGRNDPCPCGSGKKYKQCCLKREQAMHPLLRSTQPSWTAPGHPRGAPSTGVWQANFVPLSARFTDDPAALPTALLVTDGPAPLHLEVVSHPPAEPDEVAAAIEQAVLAAARQTGSLPREVRVRHAEIADALAALETRDIEVLTSALPELDALARDLRESTGMAGGGGPPAAAPETWAAWGWPEEQVAALFRAGAAFFRAEPWLDLADDQFLGAELPGGRRWTVCVLGNGGFQHGLVLYAEADDLLDMLAGEADPAGAMSHLRGPVLSFLFDPKAEMPRRMQREISKAGWEVAAPDAYPMLIALNTSGGAIRRDWADDLARLLRAVPAFADRYGAALNGHEPADLPIEWHHPETELNISYTGVPLAADIGLWEPPARLDTAAAEGPGAEPAAALSLPDDLDAFAEAELDIVRRFEEWLRATGVGAATVDKHCANAGIFVESLVRWAAIPVRAVTEYDLRFFLYDWYPRKVADSRTRALAVPVSLRRFFAFLEESKGVICPWADPILLDKEAFEIRYDSFPGGFWWDEGVEEWRAEAYLDLHHRVFIPAAELGDRDTWGATMGPVEADLHRELGRRWLLWRDEVVRAGTAEPEMVRAAARRRQHEWETTPHPRLGGKTPVEAIHAEREEQPPPG